MFRILTVLAASTTLAALAFAAEDTPRTKPVGAWERSIGDVTSSMKFTADSLTLVLSRNGDSVTVEADYGVTKDGWLFGIVTNVTKNGTDLGPAVGDLFRFRIKADKNQLTISEIKDAGDRVKQALEGDYQRKN